MREYLRINRVQAAYIIPAALYALWQACVGWLNHYWTIIYLGHEPVTFIYITFFLAHALGIAVFAWWLDRWPDRQKIMRIMLASSILTAVLTAAMAFKAAGWLLWLVLLSGAVSGLFMAYLTYFVWAEIPAHKRGITIGAASALGAALHFLVFVLLFPQQEGGILYGKTLFAALVMLLLGASMLYWPAGRDSLWRPVLENTPLRMASGVLKPGLLVPLLFIMTGFFLSYGMQDYAATGFWMGGEDSLVYTRLFLIAGLLGGGILCDLRGNHMVLNTSFSLLAMGFVAMAFQYRGAYSFIGFSCVQAAGAVFSVSSRLVFLDIARFYKKPVLVCSLGLVFPLILKLFGIISAEILYKTWGNMSIFIVSLLAILAALPLVSLLFEKLRDSFMASLRVQSPDVDLASSLEMIADSGNADAEPDGEPAAAEDKSAVEVQNPANWADMAHSFARKYDFNPRETQVLELTLHGLSVADMAQSLCIAESTVKQYVRQMLRKTGTKNRRQLLSMLIREQSPDAAGSQAESY